MKSIFLFLILLIPSVSLSQNVLDKIAEDGCSCANNLVDLKDRKAWELRLGLCIIQSSEPYRKELLNDHGIDMENVSVDGRKLGLLIGVKMADVCPEFFEAMSNVMSDDEYESEVFEFEGKVSKINQNGFVYFTIRNEEGRESKYYWLTYVDSEIDIDNNFESLSGKIVLVKYRILEIFDPKINEYRNINVLVSLNL
jgi:hypothetical protein